jgi:methylglutaconyl-CoA hydratase
MTRGEAPVLAGRDDAGVVTLTLNRPAARNSLSPDLVRALTQAIEEIEADPEARAVVLTGNGSAFCSGGDVQSMKDIASFTFEENLADSASMDAMFRAVDECSRPVIARVNGAAMGGGAGLVACADIAVAADSARFALSEVRLGIIPAVVGTYVVPKVGVSWARRLLLTGERFDAAIARHIGLVHEVVPPEELDAAVNGVVGEVLTARPMAQRTIKAHLRAIFNGALPTRDAICAEAIAAAARARMSDEGKDGLTRFLER